MCRTLLPNFRIVPTIAIMLFVLLWSQSVTAAILFGATSEDDRLYAFDPNNGNLIRTYSGVMPLDVSGMAVDSDGSLIIAGGTSGVYRFDPRTGVTTDMTPYTGAISPSIRAVTFSPSGSLLGVTSDFDALESSLVEIDILSGEIIEIGAIPYAVQGLATGPDGLLYGWNTVERSVHLFDDAANLISTTSFADGTSLQTNVQSIEFVGEQLVAHNSIVWLGPLSTTLDRVDLESGTLSSIGSVEPLYSIMALGLSPIPEPAALSLGLLGCFFLGSARHRNHRQRS